MFFQFGAAAARSPSTEEAIVQGGQAFMLLGMLLSIGTLLTAIVAAPRYPKETLQHLGWPLMLSFLLLLPLCYFQMLGYGLGGETARSNFYGNLGTLAFILIPVTFLGLLWASRRAGGKK